MLLLHALWIKYIIYANEYSLILSCSRPCISVCLFYIQICHLYQPHSTKMKQTFKDLANIKTNILTTLFTFLKSMSGGFKNGVNTMCFRLTSHLFAFIFVCHHISDLSRISQALIIHTTAMFTQLISVTVEVLSKKPTLAISFLHTATFKFNIWKANVFLCWNTE